MSQSSTSQTFVLLLILNGFLLWLIRDFNHLVSPLGLWLWLPSMLLLMPVFFLSTRQSFVTALVLGGMTEAWSPVPHGRIIFLWLFIWLVMSMLRDRIRREQIWQLTVLTITINTVCFWLWHSHWLWQEFMTMRFWIHAFMFSILNALVIGLLLPVWIRIQVWALIQFGWREEHELQ